MSDVLERLAATIRARRAASSEQSYTRRLLDAGPRHCARKLGEEAVETVLACAGESDEAVKAESADLLFHLLVALESRGVALADVLSELDRRSGTSGLFEKASRSGEGS